MNAYVYHRENENENENENERVVTSEKISTRVPKRA
jgi:hypothetical protein